MKGHALSHLAVRIMAQARDPWSARPGGWKADTNQISAMMATVLRHARCIHDRLPAVVNVFCSGADFERP